MTETIPQERWKRTQLLVGEEGLFKLQQARVAVLGMGAVGSAAVEALVRGGVSHFLIADFDQLNPSNCSRNLLAQSSTLGRPKVEVAQERIKGINPNAEVTVYQGFVARESFDQIFTYPLEYLVDAIDSVGPKVSVLRESYQHGIKTISCMGAGNKLDPSQIIVEDISQTKICPLARRVRRYLARLGIRQGVRCVYSQIRPLALENGGPLAGDDPGYLIDRGRIRRVVGTMSYLPMIIGATAASEVIRDILGEKRFK
jgi:tRNA threonylcarbamoyladenosine dehydratase